MTSKQGVLKRHCDTSVIQTYIYPLRLLTTPIEQLSVPRFTWALVYPHTKTDIYKQNPACCLQLSCATVFWVETTIDLPFFLWEIFKSAVTPVFLGESVFECTHFVWATYTCLVKLRIPGALSTGKELDFITIQCSHCEPKGFFFLLTHHWDVVWTDVSCVIGLPPLGLLTLWCLC